MIEAVASVSKEALLETAKEVKDVKGNVQEKPSEMKKEAVTNVETRNKTLEGDCHPITGVPFERKEVVLASGEKVEGVFPEFEKSFEATLSEDQYQQSDARQFNEANGQLKEAIENDSTLGDTYTEDQLRQIEAGDTPEGYVWHHSEQPGKLQLVDKTTHDLTGHTGGRALWGGGSDFR